MILALELVSESQVYLVYTIRLKILSAGDEEVPNPRKAIPRFDGFSSFYSAVLRVRSPYSRLTLGTEKSDRPNSVSILEPHAWSLTDLPLWRLFRHPSIELAPVCQLATSERPTSGHRVTSQPSSRVLFVCSLRSYLGIILSADINLCVYARSISDSQPSP